MLSFRRQREQPDSGGTSPTPFRPAIPPLTDQALSYTWRQLLIRAGCEGGVHGPPFTYAGVHLLYENPDEVQHGERCIIVEPCLNSAWRELARCRVQSLRQIPIEDTIPSDARLPFDTVTALLWGAAHERRTVPFVERRDRNKVVFHADIVAATFFMLSRWEETGAVERDEHGRFPAHASVAFRYGFLGRPVVDEYGLVLRQWLEAIAPGSVMRRSQFSVRLSHDIDHVRSSARSIAAQVLRGQGRRRTLDALAQWCIPSRDPCLRACYELAETSERNGFTSSFYLKASSRGPQDSGYDPNRRVLRRCLQELQRRGHEIGFHPGYETFQDFDLFLAEKSRLETALDCATSGGRQHYLRFNVASTWRCWEEAGLVYDSTVGYAEHEGFRCGTCHPYAPFSIEEDREYQLIEVPLLVMDTTLRGYRNLTPVQAEQAVLELARRCKIVEGVFTLLWHNSSPAGSWEAWFSTYRRVVDRLGEMVASA